ncbi:MAG: cupin domain-containing protein, partial [Hominenteromicrobium sp.]
MQAYKEQLWRYADRRQLHFSRNSASAPKTMVAPHWHEGYEILYIRSGWGKQQINTQTLPFHPGEAAVICPGDIHATEALSPAGCEIDVVQFTEDMLSLDTDPR